MYSTVVVLVLGVGVESLEAAHTHNETIVRAYVILLALFFTSPVYWYWILVLSINKDVVILIVIPCYSK